LPETTHGVATAHKVLSCMVFKSGVSKGIAFAWLANKLSLFKFSGLLKKELKNTTLLLLKSLALIKLSQDVYIEENSKTKIQPK